VLSIARCTVIVSALTLTACASSTPPARPALPASLTQPCPPLPPLTDGQAATVLRALVDRAQLYRDCAERHRLLGEAAGG
jgi:hypothetical protein